MSLFKKKKKEDNFIRDGYTPANKIDYEGKTLECINYEGEECPIDQMALSDVKYKAMCRAFKYKTPIRIALYEKFDDTTFSSLVNTLMGVHNVNREHFLEIEFELWKLGQAMLDHNIFIHYLSPISQGSKLMNIINIFCYSREQAKAIEDAYSSKNIERLGIAELDRRLDNITPQMVPEEISEVLAK